MASEPLRGETPAHFPQVTVLRTRRCAVCARVLRRGNRARLARVEGGPRRRVICVTCRPDDVAPTPSAAVLALSAPVIPALSSAPRGIPRHLDGGGRPRRRRAPHLAHRPPPLDDGGGRPQGRRDGGRTANLRTTGHRAACRAARVRGPRAHVREARPAGRLERGALPRAVLPGVPQVPRPGPTVSLRGGAAHPARGARTRPRRGLRVHRSRRRSRRRRSLRSMRRACATDRRSSSRCSARGSPRSSRPTCASSASAPARWPSSPTRRAREPGRRRRRLSRRRSAPSSTFVARPRTWASSTASWPRSDRPASSRRAWSPISRRARARHGALLRPSGRRRREACGPPVATPKSVSSSGCERGSSA